jgi:methionine-gamma-lyase
MEGTETANVAASGMGCHNTYFITTLWYWRSYCFEPYDIWWNMRFEKNFTPRLVFKTFVDITKLDIVEQRLLQTQSFVL